VQDAVQRAAKRWRVAPSGGDLGETQPFRWGKTRLVKARGTHLAFAAAELRGNEVGAPPEGVSYDVH
jgi:hypothetical protein